ncbi:MAG: aminopeptidase P N-terminal domain-containing protein [Firmicutes bacterium]|nr:aminopeptidase P N-terminal domain-containing protein [Bacillota bacterium]
MTDFYKNNRKRLTDCIDDNSAVLILSGGEVRKMGDENFPFAPSANFLYFTDIDKPNEILLLVKAGGETAETLFIEPFDEEKAKWVGPVIMPDEAKQISGIEDIKHNYTINETFAGIIFNKRIQNVYLDLENRVFDMHSPEIELANKISAKYPYINIKNLYNTAAELRRVKQPRELENLRRAIEITGEGVVNMMKNARPDMFEYEIEAYFDFTLKSRGVKDFAFKSIVAAGKNAAVLHYSQNDGKAEDGSLVLCDVGAKYKYYCGDITRTFPVSGKFTERQKLLYNIVLNGQKLILDTIRPGIPFKSLNETLLKYYEKELANIGLISSPEEVKKYYWHSVSHMLGIETHDAGRHNEGLLEAGMVLTVEPGLYIAEEGIGIRIEDDAVVTENGCEPVYAGIPKTVEEIEAIMGGR